MNNPLSVAVNSSMRAQRTHPWVQCLKRVFHADINLTMTFSIIWVAEMGVVVAVTKVSVNVAV